MQATLDEGKPALMTSTEPVEPAAAESDVSDS